MRIMIETALKEPEPFVPPPPTGKEVSVTAMCGHVRVHIHVMDNAEDSAIAAAIEERVGRRVRVRAERPLHEGKVIEWQEESRDTVEIALCKTGKGREYMRVRRSIRNPELEQEIARWLGVKEGVRIGKRPAQLEEGSEVAWEKRRARDLTGGRSAAVTRADGPAEPKRRGREAEYWISGCGRDGPMWLPEFEPEQWDRILSEELGRPVHAEQKDMSRFRLALIERAVWDSIRSSSYGVRVLARLGERVEPIDTRSDSTEQQLMQRIREIYGDVKAAIPSKPWEEEITVQCTQIPPKKNPKEWKVTAWYQDMMREALAPGDESREQSVTRMRGLMSLARSIRERTIETDGERCIEFGEPWVEKTIKKGGIVKKFRHRPEAGDDEIVAYMVRSTGVRYDPVSEVMERRKDEIAVRAARQVKVVLVDGEDRCGLEVSEKASAIDIAKETARQVGELVQVVEDVPELIPENCEIRVSRQGSVVGSETSAPPEQEETVGVNISDNGEKVRSIRVRTETSEAEMRKVIAQEYHLRSGFTMGMVDQKGVRQRKFEIGEGWLYEAEYAPEFSEQIHDGRIWVHIRCNEGEAKSRRVEERMLEAEMRREIAREYT
jgi:hypothetical protein